MGKLASLYDETIHWHLLTFPGFENSTDFKYEHFNEFKVIDATLLHKQLINE